MSAPVINYKTREQEAIETYWKGEGFRFDAAVLAFQAQDKNAVAIGWKRSPSLVYKYSDVGELWLTLLRIVPTMAEVWRAELSISFWFPIAALVRSNTLNLEQAAHWMDEALNNKWTVEELRSKLPRSKPEQSEWRRSASKLVALATDLISAPAFGVRDNDYRVARALLKATVKWLKKITEDK